MVWPSDKKVHVYLPEAWQEFHGSQTVFRLAQEMPDTQFLITAHSGKKAPRLTNVEYLDWVAKYGECLATGEGPSPLEKSILEERAQEFRVDYVAKQYLDILLGVAVT